MGVTEKYENAEALLFPSVTMCPVVNVDDENLEAAVLNSNSAELWFNSTSDHSSKLALEGGRFNRCVTTERSTRHLKHNH